MSRLRRRAGKQNRLGFSLIEDLLVSQHILDEIQSELEGVKKHNDALMVFERHSIRACSQALALLGYKVNGAAGSR